MNKKEKLTAFWEPYGERTLWEAMGENHIADLHFDYGNRTIAAFDFDGELAAEAETLERLLAIVKEQGQDKTANGAA